MWHLILWSTWAGGVHMGSNYSELRRRVILDAESEEWLSFLRGAEIDIAVTRLHKWLLRVALSEAHRRSVHSLIKGPELEDIAHQAAADAAMSIMDKLATFRGESRFTTWAYRFVINEVSHKLSRHHWRNPIVHLEDEDWDRLPDRVGMDPGHYAVASELIGLVRHALDHALTDHQRKMFLAVVVHSVPLQAVAMEFGISRNAIYKVVFDARRKIRAFLVASGYLDQADAASF